ncbi:LysR substrate-binding domain-containing protein [Paremcibacter congregatus]|uniref:HTH lysR-type domain-containing protein n=1 Tax=Paremcibacter congregatus TaxID=2043170 RepID=A0A2G4YTC7_9PROT|nr:LysR substrate-binding domain-containing protein [Paremcibacter congregatus]PHZ85584.1 hypothetical protein CRD36_02520 [Paremcibacter congregatus]QDE26544.1 LysR family transcriptional regulator [Paremcibacter congregatus]
MFVSPAILSALPAFDAVARLRSFGAAGEALNISQSAVSHRIKHLEEQLDVRLIRRTTRALELTPEGLRFADAARQALAEMEGALYDLKQDKDEGMIILSALASLAAKWLVPHLVEFYRAYPGSQVSVMAQDALVDLSREPVDAGLRYSRAPQPGLHATHLCKDWLVPIASPRLFKDGKIPTTPEDLARFPLMSYTASLPFDIAYSWKYWFEQMGSDIEPELVGPYYDRADIMIQTAIAGHGIVLGRAMLMEKDLFDQGLLVQVGPKVRAQASYYFVTLPDKARWPKIVIFREWLQQTMGESYARISEFLY